MIAQLVKELKVYFSGILGYLIIGIFLLINGLMLWVFNGPFNLLDGGYASLEHYFALAPWVFLFLIPAVSMRVFSDEIRTGMLELLLVRPISTVKLVLAKYLATLSVVILSILPTMVFWWSISALGSPAGNLDWGATAGSFVGLIALGAAYTAVGVFTSSLSSNNVVSFVSAVAVTMALYLGFEALADLYKFSGWELTVRSLGINEHYTSLSRGVIDARDLAYFAAVMLFFISGTIVVIGRSHLARPIYAARIPLLLFGLSVLIVLTVSFRVDLTEEKRFSLSSGTKELLNKVEEPLLIKIFLEGSFPAGFERLQSETRYLLEEWAAANSNIFFEFINPNDAEKPAEFKNQLATQGIKAVQLQVQSKDGSSVLNVFPGAVLSYKEKEATAILLQDVMVFDPAEQVNISIQQLEYNLANALKKLVMTEKPSLAFITGHGELTSVQTAGIGTVLTEYYKVDRFSMQTYKALPDGSPDLQDMVRRLNSYDIALIAKPTEPFSELDKYLLDQYLMGGGKLIWALDGVHAEMDSLSYGPEFLAYPVIYDIGLTDLLFKYGVRVGADLIQDVRCAGVNDRRSIQPWVYFPLLAPSEHPAVANLNAIKGEFSSTMELLEQENLKHSVLLTSSNNSKSVAAPHTVSLESLYYRPDPRTFQQRSLVAGVLIEGEFESAYANRIAPREAGESLPQMKKSPHTAIAVFSDGDILRNQINLINPELPRGQPLPLGFDQHTGIQYGNDDLILNLVDYLLDDQGLMESRTRDIKLRLLDGEKITHERLKWQLINVGIPLILLLFAGVTFNTARRRAYGK